MEEEEKKKATLQLITEWRDEENMSVWLYRDHEPMMWFSSWFTAWTAQAAVALTLQKEGYEVIGLEEKESGYGIND